MTYFNFISPSYTRSDGRGLQSVALLNACAADSLIAFGSSLAADALPVSQPIYSECKLNA